MVEHERLFDSGRGPQRLGGAPVSDRVREQGASLTTLFCMLALAEDVFGSIEPLPQVQCLDDVFFFLGERCFERFLSEPIMQVCTSVLKTEKQWQMLVFNLVVNRG